MEIPSGVVSTERDTAGIKRERWVEQDFHAVSREREVNIQYDVEVVDTHGRSTLAKFTRGATAYARVVFTDFAPEGDCSDYSLVPPAVRTNDTERTRRIELGLAAGAARAGAQGSPAHALQQLRSPGVLRRLSRAARVSRRTAGRARTGGHRARRRVAAGARHAEGAGREGLTAATT